MTVSLRYEDGTLRVTSDAGVPDGDGGHDATPGDDVLDVDDIPGVDQDTRSATGRAAAFRYAEIRDWLGRHDRPTDDAVLDLDPVPDLHSNYDLRPYQGEALDAWAAGGTRGDDLPNRGCIELPTGSGKTVVAIAAIERLQTPTLVVVPTLDLVHQWRTELEREFDAPVGQFGGGEQREEVLTVSTYDSAYLKAEDVGDRFGFVVFDEVHHLGGEGYRDIGRLLAAPARMGLTATFERPDDAHEVVTELVGPLVYRLSADDLAGDHLASYDVKRLTVELTAAERERYEEHQSTFTDYLARSNIRFTSGSDYQELVKRSGNDPEAREALLAKQRARRIMMGSQAKVDALEGILHDHRHDRVIVFTAHNALAYDISERFLIPTITHETGTGERREVLDRFRDGTYSRVVTSNVLDEGVDVPDANVAVILSGSGSEREFTQRLGRILRPKEDGGRALLYEVVSAETAEERVASRRRG